MIRLIRRQFVHDLEGVGFSGERTPILEKLEFYGTIER
ncbi:hypothetical protein NIES2104_20070 [Leptolyngbya sp. NIES-2104]|nr:hypothetical protein NIES2104_20070 [Leptolyngbya sp. NIES-2104]